MIARWQTSFNPRARAGRDLLKSFIHDLTSTFQSTRPRGARHAGADARAGGGRVSIHAPAWGATGGHADTLRQGQVSIHAPAWGATAVQPRHLQVADVSIHAPAWGATMVDSRQDVPVSFQSTRPRGARLSPNWTNTNYSTKQSYIQAATKLTKITRPAVPQFCCQGTRANIVINQHHLPFARHRARRLAKPQGHKVSSHQNAPPFFANSSRGYIHAGYLLTHQ